MSAGGKTEWADFDSGKEFDFTAQSNLEDEKKAFKTDKEAPKQYSKNKGFFDQMPTAKMGEETDETAADWEGGAEE